jgi:hypothetical protein
MSKFIESLKKDRARLAPLVKAKKKHEADVEKLNEACRDYLQQGLGSADRRFAEAKAKRNEATLQHQAAIDAEKRIAEIDRIINAKAEFADNKQAVEVAYQNRKAAMAMKKKTEELVARLESDCSKLESDIQQALDDHGKKQVQAMLDDGGSLPVPSRIRELKDSLEAAKASLLAAQEALELSGVKAAAAEAKANEAYNDYMDKRLSLAELNYLLALEEVFPEFAEYAAIKGIVKGVSGTAQNIISVDLGPGEVQAAKEIIFSELKGITGRNGS